MPDATRQRLLSELRTAGCVFAEDELAEFTAAATHPDDVVAMVHRRVLGEPVEYIVGRARFSDLMLTVTPGVFVPRPRTEYLARRAAALLTPSSRLLDLGCGVGTIAAWCIAHVPGITVVAADIDPDAVACAQLNLPTATVVTSDGFVDVPAGTFDVIAANLPYVPAADITYLPHEAKDHEHRMALDGGTDGLEPLRAVADDIPMRLTTRGSFLVEVSWRQRRTAARILNDVGLDVNIHHDEEFDATVIHASARSQ